MLTVPDGGTALDAVRGIKSQVCLKQLDLAACIAVVSIVPLALQFILAGRHLQQLLHSCSGLRPNNSVAWTAKESQVLTLCLVVCWSGDLPAGTPERKRGASGRAAHWTPQRRAKTHCSAAHRAGCPACKPHNGRRRGLLNLSAASVPVQSQETVSIVTLKGAECVYRRLSSRQVKRTHIVVETLIMDSLFVAGSLEAFGNGIATEKWILSTYDIICSQHVQDENQGSES